MLKIGDRVQINNKYIFKLVPIGSYGTISQISSNHPSGLPFYYINFDNTAYSNVLGFFENELDLVNSISIQPSRRFQVGEKVIITVGLLSGNIGEVKNIDQTYYWVEITPNYGHQPYLEKELLALTPPNIPPPGQQSQAASISFGNHGAFMDAAKELGKPEVIVCKCGGDKLGYKIGRQHSSWCDKWKE